MVMMMDAAAHSSSPSVYIRAILRWQTLIFIQDLILFQYCLSLAILAYCFAIPKNIITCCNPAYWGLSQSTKKGSRARSEEQAPLHIIFPKLKIMIALVLPLLPSTFVSSHRVSLFTWFCISQTATTFPISKSGSTSKVRRKWLLQQKLLLLASLQSRQRKKSSTFKSGQGELD